MDQTVVMCYGSWSLKAGLAALFPGDHTQPGVVLPAAVREIPSDGTAERRVNGPAMQAGRPIMEDSQIADWDGFEALLHDILYEQGAEADLLLGEPLMTGRLDQERLAQLLFEQFNVNALCAVEEPVMAMYAMGKLSGTVVDIGHSRTGPAGRAADLHAEHLQPDIATVIEGALQPHVTRRLSLSGAALTAHLTSLVAHQCSQPLDPYAAAALKAACIKVQESGPAAQAHLDSKVKAERHRLPDGQTIAVTTEGLQLGEALLHPSQLGLDEADLAESTALQILQQGEAPLRKMLMESIVTCGGGAMVPGLEDRLARDMGLYLPGSMAAHALFKPEYMPDHTRQYASWMGGAILAKLAFSQANQQISRSDYSEHGPSVVHRRCTA